MFSKLMPICINCGKILKTQQSLEYHYNRKINCKTLKCKICDVQFFTKFSFDIHEYKTHNVVMKNQNGEYVIDQVAS